MIISDDLPLALRVPEDSFAAPLARGILCSGARRLLSRDRNPLWLLEGDLPKACSIYSGVPKSKAVRPPGLLSQNERPFWLDIKRRLIFTWLLSELCAALRDLALYR